MKKILPFLALTSIFSACKKEDVSSPNYPATIFKITQAPGQNLTFEFAFSADQENLIVLQKAGQVVVSKNIDQADAQAPFSTGFNTTGIPVTYEITHKFKTQRGNSPWLNGVGLIDSINSEQIAYKFDDRDAIDSDYNDAVVTVTSSYKK